MNRKKITKDVSLQTSLLNDEKNNNSTSSSNKIQKRRIVESDSESDDQEESIILNENSKKSKTNTDDEFVKPMNKIPQNISNNKQKIDDDKSSKSKKVEGSKYLKLNDSIEVQSVRKAEEIAKNNSKNNAEISREEVSYIYSQVGIYLNYKK